MDGVPSGVWPLFQVVVDDVGPEDDRFEDPAVGKTRKPASGSAMEVGESHTKTGAIALGNFDDPIIIATPPKTPFLSRRVQCGCASRDEL